MSTEAIAEVRFRPAVARRASSWQPGQPLILRPRGAAFSQQTVRPVFELVDDTDWLVESFHDHARASCTRCDVAWHPDALDRCWSCGPNPTSSGPGIPGPVAAT